MNRFARLYYLGYAASIKYEKEIIMKKLKLLLVCTVISVIGVFGLTGCFSDGSSQQGTGNGNTTGQTTTGNNNNATTGNTNNGTTQNGNSNNGNSHNGNGTTDNEKETNTDGDGNIIDGVGDMIYDGLDEIETVIDDIDGNNANGNNSRMR